jgi:cysteine desulfurase/selenocysteine lyase
VLARVANELYAAPPAPSLGAAPLEAAPLGLPSPVYPSPLAAPVPTRGPSFEAIPETPRASTVSPARAPTSGPAAGSPIASEPARAFHPSTQLEGSPFHAPLDFGAIATLADPFAALLDPAALGFGEVAPHERGFEARSPALPSSLQTPSPHVPSVHALNAPSVAAPSLGSLLDPHEIKREFPILHQTVNGRPLVWLDNAATTQKPSAVIDRLRHFYEHENSNIHRAAHTLAARATDAYERARETVRRFLGAPSARDIVFVRGATEGINLVAQSWGRRHVGPGDEIVVTWLEHHANIVPWQQLCEEKGARLCVAPVDDRGQVILEEYEKLLGPRTRLVAITQVSNALGTITPVEAMVAMAKRHGARVLVDGAQAVSHLRVNVQALGCDFYVFSGHKVFAPTGIGAVFGRGEILDVTPPWQGGGNMIQDVTFERTLYQPAPARFEAGTGNIADAVGLGAALEWVERVGIERIAQHEHELLVYGTERLQTVRGLRLIGTATEKAGVLSFVLDGQKTESVGGMLDREGIAVRSGHHCAQPILRRFGLEATVRASLAPYNTHDDIDALVAALHRIQAGR